MECWDHLQSLRERIRLPRTRWFRASGGLGLRWRRFFGGILALCVAWVSVPAHASRFVMLTIDELSRSAEAVVHGRVVALEVRRDTEGRVFTRVELVLEDVWKGRMAGHTCVLVQGGGTLGEVDIHASGQAEFAVGDEVVAYMTRSPRGEWITVGLSQGRFQVSRDEATGYRWVRNRSWGGHGELGNGRGMAWPPGRPLRLEELKRRTQEVVP